MSSPLVHEPHRAARVERSTWLWLDRKVKSPTEHVDFWIGWSGLMVCHGLLEETSGIFRKISFVLFVDLFWGTCKICRKRNLVGHGIEGDHKNMVPEWKRKMYLWMKLRRGYKETKRMISSKQCDLFSKRSFEKLWVSSIACYRDITKEPDQNPDCKEFEDEGVSVVISDNSGGLTEKRQGQWKSRQKFRVKEGSFLSLSRPLLFLPFPPSLSPSLPLFLPPF